MTLDLNKQQKIEPPSVIQLLTAESVNLSSSPRAASGTNHHTESINWSAMWGSNYVQTGIHSFSCISVQPIDLFRLWAESHQVQSFAIVRPMLLEDVVLPRTEFMSLALAQILRRYLQAVVNGG